MVGRKTWQTDEIVRILRARRCGKSFADILELHNAKSSHHIVELESIKYVWNTYMKDPSYNHVFSEQEESLILEMFHANDGNQDILDRFQREFPAHIWGFTHPIVGIESVIAEHTDSPPSVETFSIAEVSFIMGRHHAGETIQDILSRFYVEFRDHKWQCCAIQLISIDSAIAIWRSNPEFTRECELAEIRFILTAKAEGDTFKVIFEKFKSGFPGQETSFARTVYVFWRYILDPKHLIPHKLDQNVPQCQPRIQLPLRKLLPKAKSRANRAASELCGTLSYRVSKPKIQSNCIREALERGEIILKEPGPSWGYSEPTAVSKRGWAYQPPPRVPKSAADPGADSSHLSSPILLHTDLTEQQNADYTAQQYPCRQNSQFTDRGPLAQQYPLAGSQLAVNQSDSLELSCCNAHLQLPPLYQDPATMSNVWGPGWLAAQSPQVKFPGPISHVNREEPGNASIFIPPIYDSSTTQQGPRDSPQQEIDEWFVAQDFPPEYSGTILNPANIESNKMQQLPLMPPFQNSTALPVSQELAEELDLDLSETLDFEVGSLEDSSPPGGEEPDYFLWQDQFTESSRVPMMGIECSNNSTEWFSYQPAIYEPQEDILRGVPFPGLTSTAFNLSAPTCLQDSPEFLNSYSLEQDMQLGTSSDLSALTDLSPRSSPIRELDSVSPSQTIENPSQDDLLPQDLSPEEEQTSPDDDEFDHFFSVFLNQSPSTRSGSSTGLPNME